MTKATATVAAMVAMVTAGAGRPADAASHAERVVVVHVTDYAQISPSALEAAEQLAARVYSSVGVQVIWADDQVKTAQPDGSFNVQVVLLSRAMTTMKCLEERIPDSTFGTATKAGGRAYIFYNRIADHAAHTQTAVSRPLGLVLAHEIGHLLLPAYSHSRTGIMRAAWDGPMLLVPDFTNEQGAAIRGLLTAVHAN